MCALAIREIESLEELDSIRGDWLALWRSLPTATPFQSPDWLIPWWKHFGVDRLRVLVLLNDERVVGIAPLFVGVDLRLRLVGTGNTDYMDILAEDPEYTSVAFQYLCRNRSWDEIDFENLRHDSPLLISSMRHDVSEYVEEQDVCPVLCLPSSANDFITSLPRQLQHNLNYYRRKLGNLGHVKLEQANENNFDELFEALLSLHEARWRMNHLSGVLCADEVQNFHQDAAYALLSHNALRLYGLRLDARIIACLYAFHHGHCTYYYLSGFDPEFRQYSPGTILVAHAIHEAIGEGDAVFDFLRGREEYKYRWGATDRPIYRKQVIWTASPLS
jgi:CelD/BcsL family acetyltransferase involved in cellulose biosynthesis